MSWLLICMVIFVTFAALMFGVGAALKRGQRELDRILALDRAAQPVARVELPRAGRFDVTYLPGPPFAGAQDRGYELVDTGPLLLLSDKMAAEVALERDVRAMIEAGEEKIPPRWRS